MTLVRIGDRYFEKIEWDLVSASNSWRHNLGLWFKRKFIDRGRHLFSGVEVTRDGRRVPFGPRFDELLERHLVFWEPAGFEIMLGDIVTIGERIDWQREGF